MSFNLSLTDFRGFHVVNPARIARITVLVGENSAGKSSFLAALKFVHDFFSGERPSFNKDPFQLGTFQQIACYRGGRAGRVKKFSITINKRIRYKNKNSNVEVSLHFHSHESQAGISEIEIKFDENILKSSFEAESQKWDFKDESGVWHTVFTSNEMANIFRKDISLYWRFLLSQIRFELSNRRKKDGADLFLTEEVIEAASAIAAAADSFARDFSGPIIATSAIRTSPSRTYTPGIEVEDGEGSHVPYELARLFRGKNKENWEKIKKEIESFGTSSKMFNEIIIKSLGNDAGEPFQIEFSSGGTKKNLVDLGYGISQVLPIIYNIASGPSRMTYLIQQPEVHLHPKAQAALGQYFVDSVINSEKTFVLETHSDFIVDRIRSAVMKGIVRPQQISILFFERSRLENYIHQIDLDSSGNLIGAPDMYRQFFLDEQLDALGLI